MHAHGDAPTLHLMRAEPRVAPTRTYRGTQQCGGCLVSVTLIRSNVIRSRWWLLGLVVAEVINYGIIQVFRPYKGIDRTRIRRFSRDCRFAE